MTPEPNTGRLTWRALLYAIVLTGLVIAFVDRPASSWAHAHLQRHTFDWLTHLVDPLLAAAVVGLIIAGLAAAFGWRPGDKARTALACCLAVIVSVALKEHLKIAFGRTWPETWVENNPSWINTGAFGFHPFHGGRGWTSFPSGHLTQMSALAAVLWWRVARLKWLWACLPLLVAVGLYGCDYHFLGDMVAGAFLGTASAAGVLALLKQRPVENPVGTTAK